MLITHIVYVRASLLPILWCLCLCAGVTKVVRMNICVLLALFVSFIDVSLSIGDEEERRREEEECM